MPPARSTRPLADPPTAHSTLHLLQEDKVNKVLPIGGPGKAMTAKDQADLLFSIVGKKPYYFPVSRAVTASAHAAGALWVKRALHSLGVQLRAQVEPSSALLTAAVAQVPVALMDGIIGLLDFLARFFPGMKVQQRGGWDGAAGRGLAGVAWKGWAGSEFR